MRDVGRIIQYGLRAAGIEETLYSRGKDAMMISRC